MPGFGPPADHPDAAPAASRDTEAAATVGTWASQQAYKLGAEQATTDPERGYELGHDVAYGADTAHRQFVHQVRAGWEAGSKAHADLSEAARQGLAAQQAREAHARLAEREQQAQHEAEAG